MAIDPAELTRSPEWFPWRIDDPADALEFVRLGAADYEAASFLDRRLTATSTAEKAVATIDSVEQALEGVAPRCGFIFHASHVGSTLLARMLGAHPGFFSLREPVTLRTLAEEAERRARGAGVWAEGALERRFDLMLRLWSRTFVPGDLPVIKATSWATELAEAAMDRVPESRAVFMYVRPLNFLRGLLGGAMVDIDERHSERVARLGRRIGVELGPAERMTPGERVITALLCETSSMQAAADRFPGRVLWVDFDALLAAPGETLARVVAHYGIGVDAARIAAILRGPILERYAKAPSVAFGPDDRVALLKRADSEHADEIRRGMELLGRFAALPGVRPILEAASKRVGIST
ncbi:MAG: hypothetical protein SFX72_06965 [Isosphaeraceae bacterium]|nr:hypothetical protein [Isosphaeraceae bacterium]